MVRVVGAAEELYDVKVGNAGTIQHGRVIQRVHDNTCVHRRIIHGRVQEHDTHKSFTKSNVFKTAKMPCKQMLAVKSLYAFLCASAYMLRNVRSVRINNPKMMPFAFTKRFTRGLASLTPWYNPTPVL